MAAGLSGDAQALGGKRKLTITEQYHTMKNIILLTIVAIGALSLTACGHKPCCKTACSASYGCSK